MLRCSECGDAEATKWRTTDAGALACKPCWKAAKEAQPSGPKRARAASATQLDLRQPAAWELPHGKEAIRRRLAEDGYHATNRKLMAIMVTIPKTARARAARDVGFVVTDERDYDALMARIDWSRVGSVLDPWAGSGTTKRVLGGLTTVRLTDIAKHTEELDALANAVERPDMEAVAAAFGPFDMVVTSPFFDMNDLALGAALRVAREGVAIHVNTRHMGQPTEGRMDRLARLAAEKRLVIIMGLQKSSRVAFNHEWVLVFHSEALKNELYIPSASEYPTVVWRPPGGGAESADEA